VDSDILKHYERECDRWGVHMRRCETGFSSTNTLARIRDERHGASHGDFGPTVPIRGMPKDLHYVHQVYLRLRDQRSSLANVMRVCFAVGDTKSRDQKAEALGMSKTQMYAERRVILNMVAVNCPDKDCGQNPP